MNSKTFLKWTAIAGTAGLLCGAGVIACRVRRRPAAGAFYVALGSSFAAGLGLGRRVSGSPFVSQRSVGSYPQQLSRMLKVPSFTDMTSSGSTMRHILHGGQMGLGPQIDALGPETRLVTLTAGGNDVSYVSDLMLAAYRHRGGLVGFVIEQFKGRTRSVEGRPFAALEAELTVTLREIRRRAPQAEIVVATYPTILPLDWSCARLGITEHEAAILRSVGSKLAEVTCTTALREQATVVDMASLSTGHDAYSAEPWVNRSPASNGADFHPTWAGALATARAIAHAIAP